ncbi:MAG TPA: cupin domain-containing protein [Vicinamibacteria bacterium]|nr:cupin domain-containing protein [Vicinamibacteria bacterium]
MTERVDKPWGYEIIWAKTERYVGKVLHIEAGEALSLQYHKVKEETIRLESGKLILEVEEPGQSRRKIVMSPGDSFHLRPGTIHRMIAEETSDVLEVSTPELDDVVRLEDRYGRAGR